MARKRGREKLEFDTPISAYSQYLLDNGRKSRRDATKADIVRREQHAPTFSEIEKKDNKNSIVELEQKVDSGQELKYEEVKDLSPEELYNVMFGTRRG